MRVRYLNLNELMEIYPASAYYDLNDDEIGIPDKDLLWKVVYGHELIHYERRNKWSEKICAQTGKLLMCFIPILLISIAIPSMIFFAVGLFALIVFIRYHEEVIVQKDMLKKMIENDQKECT